jgi:hypothetical protein
MRALRKHLRIRDFWPANSAPTSPARLFILGCTRRAVNLGLVNLVNSGVESKSPAARGVAEKLSHSSHSSQRKCRICRHRLI